MSAPPTATYAELSDDALLQQCRAGHQGAWSTLVRRYQRLVYTVPRRARLDEDMAADVFQTTFQRLFEHLDRIDDASRVRAWLVTTAKRETLRLLAERQRLVIVDQAAGGDGGDGESDAATPAIERVPDPAPLQDEQLAQLQALDRVRAAVDRLDPRARQFVELMFLQPDPLPYAELAARLGMPEGSLGPTRARCLAKLRRLLDEA